MRAPAREFLQRLLRALAGRRAVAGATGRHSRAVPVPPPGNNWPLPPAAAERLFAQAPLEMLSIEATAKGVAGACKITVALPEEARQLAAKWKVAPAGKLDSWNNNPRKELACYIVQRWFLSPQDYVVPTVALRAVPLADYRRLDASAAPNVDGTECVLGTLALWLQHTREPDVLYDRARFAADAAYAYHLSNFNVLAYLVAHRDGRAGNVLVADDDANRRVFAVDNGISFGGWIYNFLTTNWNVIRVPAIRREVAERLRALDRSALSELATLAELRLDSSGVLRWSAPGPATDPQRGVRINNGTVQFGLTAAEIDGVAQRIAALLNQVDQGHLAPL